MAKMLGRLFQMVVRYLGEHVMHLVSADIVYDSVDEAVVTVNGRELTAHEIPLVVAVPWNGVLMVV